MPDDIDAIELVARAIWETGSPPAQWPITTEEGKGKARRFAHAALTAVFDWLAGPGDAVIAEAAKFALQVELSADYKWPDYMRDMYALFIAAKRKEALGE